MRLFRSLLADGLIFGLLAVMGLFLAPAALASPRLALWAIKAYCRLALGLLRRLCGIRVEVRGAVPTGPVLVVSKHQSFLDVMIHSLVLPEPRFVMKAALLWTPVFGLYAWRIGSVPIRRDRKGRAAFAMAAAVSGTRHSGQWVIYPQGTRVPPGEPMPYRVGAALLYDRLGWEAVPAATNAGVFWARKSWLRHPGTAVVEYLPSLPAGLPRAAFMARVEREVEAASDALMAEAGFVARPPAEAKEKAKAG